MLKMDNKLGILTANEFPTRELDRDTKEYYDSKYCFRSSFPCAGLGSDSTDSSMVFNRIRSSMHSTRYRHNILTDIGWLLRIGMRQSRQPNAERGTTSPAKSTKIQSNTRKQKDQTRHIAPESREGVTMVYLVAFNLRKRRHNYDMFFATLQVDNWFNFFDNAWLISTDKTGQQLADRLNMYITTEDYLLVIRVTADYHGWLPQEAWDWLKEERDSGRLY